jgi:hypothetical protein
MSSPVKPNISLIDKSFREDHTRSFHLTIQLSLDGFFVALFVPDTQTYIGTEVYRFHDMADEEQLIAALDKILMYRQWIAYPFQSVTVMVDHTENTLVPAPLFDEKQKGNYLSFSQQYKEYARIAFDRLKHTGACNVYYLSTILVEKIKGLWANASIVHLSSVLIESLGIQYKNKPTDNLVFVHIRNRTFDLVVLKKEKLNFYNNFRFSTKEDFAYFLLFSMEQLRLNPETIDLVFIGNIENSSQLFDISWRYVRTIRYIERNNSTFDYSYVLDSLLPHQYYLLFNALQCEL